MNKILVTGASGHLGQSVVKHLLKLTAAENISILVRDASKWESLVTRGVKVQVGDYNDIDTLHVAFEGIDKLYFVSGNDIFNRELQHSKIVEAAKQSGISHIFYTSFQRKPSTSHSPIAFIDDSHKATERMIKNSGITYTILKHAFYTDMLPVFFGTGAISHGIIRLPAGKGKVSFATREDMGKAGALMLVQQESDFKNREVDIAGSEAFSLSDIARILTELTGKSIVYHDMTLAEFKSHMQGNSASLGMTHLISAFSQAIASDELNIPDNTLQKILGGKHTGIKEFFKNFYTVQ